MRTTATLKPSKQLWGIYHTDREYARVMGDPLRAVVEAPTKLAAEEAAARLGFSEPWAHPVTLEVAQRAQWLPKRRPNRQTTGNDSPTNPHAAGHKCKSRNLRFGFSEKTGGNLLSRKLYNHYHRQDCV